jgi:hypothetical protein
VLDEREKLEVQATLLSERIREEIEHVRGISDLIRTIQDHKAEINRNQNYLVKKKITKNRKIDISGLGVYTTTCLKCNYTCHNRCAYANDVDKHKCSAMDGGGTVKAKCTVCPKNCPWRDHQNLPYVIEW